MRRDDFSIPPFMSAASIFVAAAEDLAPVEAVTAAEAALRHLYIYDPRVSDWREFTFERAPFLRRPWEAFSSGGYRLVALMGPSQTAKSTFLMGCMAHTIRYAPADWIALFPDQVSARDFSNGKWQPTIEQSPDLAERVRRVPHALTTWRQQFRQMQSWFVWPVASQLRQRTVRYFLADDFDAIPSDIDGEGDPLTLLFGRTPAYEGQECGVVASSPALGVGGGIEAVVAEGTDERLHAPCPHCDEYFALDLERQLRFDDTGSPHDAAASAYVACPVNGCVIEPRDKARMISRAVWAGLGQVVERDGTVKGELRRTSTASFRIDGLAAFVSWSRLAELLREAEVEFETRQSEGKLRAFWNTRAGRNYSSRAEVKAPIKVDDLADRRDPAFGIGELPEWVRYATAAIDVQGNRFAVAVVGWGLDRRAAIVDRFDVLEYQGGPVAPHRDPEVWDALIDRVFDRVVPLVDRPAFGFWPATVAIDSQGLPGVTDNARAFVRRLRKRGVAEWRVMLTNGHQRKDAPELGTVSFEKDGAGRRLPGAVPIFNLGVNELKTTLDARLRFVDGGANSIAFPRDFAAEHFDELTAEELVDGRWTKRAPGLANETLDLMVGNIAAQMRLVVDKVDWSDPPAYAVPAPIASAPEAVAPRRHRRVRSRGIE